MMRSRSGAAPVLAFARASLLRRGCVAALAGAAIAVAGLVPASAAVPAKGGLVAAYGFEEGSGTQVADSSGKGNGGTVASATWVHSGAFGSALSFNGSTSVVTVPDSPSLHLKRAMTLEAWVKPSAVSGDWRDVVYKGDDAYYLEATSHGDGLPAGGGVFNGSRGDGQVFGPAELPTGAWTYLAVTYDGSTLRLYVDGEQVASTPQTGTIMTSSDPLQIGGDHIFGQYFGGLIDEVRVYNVALNSDAIRTDMLSPVVAGTSGDPEPPSVTGGLTASAVGPGEVDLSWTAASDNVGVTGYEVWRCQGAGCSDFTLLQTVGAVTAYEDTGVAPDTSYGYRVRALDAAGNDGPFSDPAFATPPAPPPAEPGPISVGPTGRYLVDQNGEPFLITGDSPQALIGDLSLADAETFFADRQALGFNSVWINVLCTTYTGCRADGSTWDGIPPFTTPGDLSTPNEQYFSRVDEIIRLAGKYGLVVILDPAETGGWLNTLIANGVDTDRAYGRYLGERYKDFPNIIWMSGNDYQSWGPTNDPYVTAVAQGIQDADPNHIHTIQLDFPSSGSLDDPTWAPLIKLNASYTYYPTYEQVLTDYNRSNPLPTFMVEGTYEFEQNASYIPFGDPFALRRQEYWSMLSGATGQLYGNHYTWQFLCDQRDDPSGNCVGGWKEHLDTTGAEEFKHLTDLFQSLPWYQLVPDQTHSLLTGGYGTYGDWDYATAAKTPDGSLAVAYIPTARTVTVDLSTMAGPVTARWYDPADGTYSDIAGSPFPNQGSQDFTTPGPNADGAGNDDWVLVLRAH
jgi:Protein of unknown function (DUF4038)/Concanavalin A-like lectin/glucanases superfamily/Putative collagen-binding domain of a collagenase/Fibronectin type III domain